MKPCSPKAWGRLNPDPLPAYVAMASGPCRSRRAFTFPPISFSACFQVMAFHVFPDRFIG